ncbi:MAG: CBS domain-containing protein [Candidatus Limnocylindrales bacterium]
MGDASPPEAPLGPRSTIRLAVGRLAIEPVLVAAGDPLDVVIRRAGTAPATRVLGVVDAAGVLVGVVKSHDLVAAILGRLAPGALLTKIYDADGMAEYGRYVDATVAGDLARPPAALPETATLAEAVHLMYQRELSGVYVVDAAGRPVGYLDGLELAAAVVAAD